MSILLWRNLAVFSTNLDCGNTNNGVTCNSIRCSMPDRGFAGVCSSVGLGHNSGGKSLKTSFIVLSKDQVSISNSQPKSFVEHCMICLGCGIVGTLVISAGCRIIGVSAACRLCTSFIVAIIMGLIIRW